MSDTFHIERLKRIDDINKQYAMSLSELDEWKQTEISKLYQEMEIKQAGWEAFEMDKILHKNPYKFSKETNKFNHWKIGWEMAHADNETKKSND